MLKKEIRNHEDPKTQMRTSLQILSGPQAVGGMILKFQSWNDPEMWEAGQRVCEHLLPITASNISPREARSVIATLKYGK